MAKKIYVLMETNENQFTPISAKLLTYVTNIFPSAQIQTITLDETNLAGDLINELNESADVLITLNRVSAKEFLAAYSVKFHVYPLTNIVSLKDENQTIAVRTLDVDNMLEKITNITMKSAFAINETILMEVEISKFELPNIHLKAKKNTVEIIKTYTASRSEIGVDEAKIVVAGGAGLENAENFKLLDDFAAKIDAALGGTRVALDMNLIDKKQMIGATGLTIAPKIYLGFAISGAVQHLVGILGSENIISVNTDEMSSLSANANIAVVGDAKAVLVELNSQLQAYQVKRGEGK